MPTVEITKHMRRHVDLPPREVEGDTVRAALTAFLAQDPRALAYVFDEQGALRHHVTVFVDAVAIDRNALDAEVAPSAKVFVMQALSGG
jgi:molybdopterin synthase sulfur carrier subunit